MAFKSFQNMSQFGIVQVLEDKLYGYFWLSENGEGKRGMQTQLTMLLLTVSSVALASVVIGFAVSVSEQTLNLNSNPQVERIQDLQQQMLNETNSWLDSMQDKLFNQTAPAAGP